MDTPELQVRRLLALRLAARLLVAKLEDCCGPYPVWREEMSLLSAAVRGTADIK